MWTGSRNHQEKGNSLKILFTDIFKRKNSCTALEINLDQQVLRTCTNNGSDAPRWSTYLLVTGSATKAVFARPSKIVPCRSDRADDYLHLCCPYIKVIINVFHIINMLS